MPLKRITLSLLISSFFLTSNFESTATFTPSAEEGRETPQYSLHNSISISCMDLLKSSEIHTQESELRGQIQHQSLRASFPLETLSDLPTKGKALIVLSLLPIVQAETPQADTIATNFYGTVLPTIIGASFLSAIIGPTVKDCMYRSYNKLMSSQFGRLHDFIDTTPVLRWPHESLRWSYFALLRGNRDIGDIPVAQNATLNWWRSFYEWSTSQPYTVELRHAEKLSSFSPFVVQNLYSIDKELTQEKGWVRRELYKQPQGLFKGLSYQGGACELHIRGAPHTDIFEGISSYSPPYNPVKYENRLRTWKTFFAAYKNEEIELLPSSVYKLLEKFVVYIGKSEEDKIDILLQNNKNTLFFIYKKGLVLALQKNPFPSETIIFREAPLSLDHSQEEATHSTSIERQDSHEGLTTTSSSSSYSERDVKNKRKEKLEQRKKRNRASSTEEESVV